MPQALFDTSVLFAAAYRADASHDAALDVLHGVDEASLPEAVVLDFVLAETLNGLTAHAGPAAATDFLDRIETNARFHVASLHGDAFAAGKSVFRRFDQFSFVDACVVAYARAEGLEYVYAFDDDFDAADGVSRLDTPTNPYGPT